MTKIFDTVQSALVDSITSLDRPYACDLHHAIYNEPQHFIYYAEAKEATAELDVWECIGAVQVYEKAQFGEVYTPLSDSCRVANMIVYILGEALLYEIFNDTVYFDAKWDEQLSDEDLSDMLTIVRQWFEENPDGLEKLWNALDIN